MIPRPDSESGQVMGQPVGPLLEFGVGDLPIAAGHRDTIAEGVGRMLEEVGEVQGHGNESRTCYCSGQAFRMPEMGGIAVTATAAHDTGDASGSGQPHALIERRGHVLIVTMNRPRRATR